MSENIDQKLFPLPYHQGAFKNPLFPRTWPGVTPASTTALQGILTDNHKRWHVFFNDRGFHNHAAHAALSLWCLGADESILKASYEENCKEQRPAFPPPEPITKQNWRDHLGDEKFYQGYLDFFKGELEHKAMDTLLEEYVFSGDANFIPGAKHQPELLNRFFEGLLHPMIHTGFGVEFSLPGTFAEGLSQTAVHGASSTKVLPPTMFVQSEAGLASRFASVIGLGSKVEKKDVHAFTILARVLADPAFVPTKIPDEYGFYKETVELHGDAIQKHVDQWSLNGDLQKKLDELVWTNALIYGVGGFEGDGKINADFFYMHLVTSSLFLSSIFSHVKRSSQVILLRGYFAVCLGWYISRGRPPIDIASFFKDASSLPVAPGPQPTPHKTAHPSPTSPHAITPDPWLPIIQSTLTHPDDHLPKLQRALSEYASHFGSTPAGTFADTELKDAELIDGTLFIRTAGLTATRMGWLREGVAPLDNFWDRKGFFDNLKL
ncbi:hypothetical protein GALMADRAFT_745407 [Galerina marginata CBS 339.88]|uniref:Oxidoreductase AflY n=1 Tax=Galerina marginata (strain CBS 339.88) TaxID=685588 RepID=A0A067SSL1_GALM3|nr:hypothetical protein GALMADRAFT_745407 [Galerina marginata CBS 339.88]